MRDNIVSKEELIRLAKLLEDEWEKEYDQACLENAIILATRVLEYFKE